MLWHENIVWHVNCLFIGCELPAAVGLNVYRNFSQSQFNLTACTLVGLRRYTMHLVALCIIQLNSFLMTLRRKNIVAVLATSMSKMETQLIRDKEFFPPEFYNLIVVGKVDFIF